MKNRILGWVLAKRTELANRKRPHRCLDCDEISVPVRRMSILNILAYIVLGIIIGGFTLYKIGFVTALIAVLINATRIHPTCGKCFNTNIAPISWSELKKLQEKKEGR